VVQQSRATGRQAAPGRTARRTERRRPAERPGALSAGGIVKLLIGQSHGFIRLADSREIYFHRSDLEEGASFNDFTIGVPRF
jgi:hypothetical protein